MLLFAIFVVARTVVLKARGRGRGTRMKQMERKHNRRGSNGSNTSLPPVPGHLQNRPGPDRLPYTAMLPQGESPWGTTTCKQVLGNKVVLTNMQVPKDKPKILVLTDQMLELIQRPDKYLHVLAMTNYAIHDYIRDLQDELIDVEFPFIVIYLGTMQIGVFDSKALQKQVVDLMLIIHKRNPSAWVTFTGLVP